MNTGLKGLRPGRAFGPNGNRFDKATVRERFSLILDDPIGCSRTLGPSPTGPIPTNGVLRDVTAERMKVRMMRCAQTIPRLCGQRGMFP